MVEDGQFRQDLFYRINTVTIELPPLRNRPEDIPALVESFINKYAKYLFNVGNKGDRGSDEKALLPDMAGEYSPA